MSPNKRKPTKRIAQWYALDSQKKKGLGLIGLGFCFIIIVAGWRIHNSNILAFDQQAVVNQPTHNSTVSSISIPKVGLHLSVDEAAVSNGDWEISSTQANHWNTSANPGENGNIVLYAHNKTSLFGPIRWLNQGDTIELLDHSNRTHTYIITDTVTTTPDDISYVLPRDEEMVTLYTCTGFFDSQRYIVVARPV